MLSQCFTVLSRGRISNFVVVVLNTLNIFQQEFTGYMKGIDDFFKAGANSAISNFFPWLRFLPGDLFSIKRKASIYKYVGWRFFGGRGGEGQEVFLKEGVE